MEIKTNYWKFQAKTAKIGELMIYGYIADEKWSDTDVTPKEFKKEMDALGDIDTLNIYINSGGGSVFAAMAMLSMIKRHKAKKEIHIDGLAASAASFFVGAGKVFMPSNAMLMVHNPMGLFIGNSKEARKFADDLDKIRESMLAIYSEKTGMTDEEIIALLDAETWMTAEEAVDYGFADEVEAEKKVAASINGDKFFINGVEMDLNNFKNRESFKKRFVASGSKTQMDLYQKVIENNERRMKFYNGVYDSCDKSAKPKEMPMYSVDKNLVDRVVACISYCKKDLNLPDDIRVRYYDPQSSDFCGFVFFNEVENEIWINSAISRFNEDAQNFVVRHECKHIQQKLQGKPADEGEADSYAHAAVYTTNNNYSIQEFCSIHGISNT